MQLLRIKALNKANASLFKLGTHRRIHITVTAGHLMPKTLG